MDFGIHEIDGDDLGVNVVPVMAINEKNTIA
jgi:hypothetical protein